MPLGKVVTHHERMQIEILLKAGHTAKEIASLLGRHVCTIYREMHRGKTTQRNSDWTEREIYSPDLAQYKYDQRKRDKGPELKIGNDMEFVKYIESKILDERKSFAAALADIQREGREFKTKVCLTTLYNYVKAGVFLNLKLENCPYHRSEPKKRKKKVQKRASRGTSIEKRPKEIDTREEFGHWEMDSVLGIRTDKKALLVMTERKTRMEMVFLMKEHTAAEVVRILDRLERSLTEKKFRQIFKTITVDNGVEFSDAEGMARSRRNKTPRTEIFYCHAYSSFERGSNENLNLMVRRFFPKGESMADVTKAAVKEAVDYINNYPRKIHGYKTAADLYEEELSLLAS